jgi:hypothetical protein
MDSKHSLHKDVASNLAEAMNRGGNAAVFFAGIACQSPTMEEERRIASTVLIPAMRQAGGCHAFRFGTGDMDASFGDLLVSAGKRQMGVRLDLPDERLLVLLVGTRAKRPTLVWALSMHDECFTQLLDGAFDPHVLINPRTVSGSGAIRFAQRNAALYPDRIWLVLPSNKNLSGCLLYFQKSRAPEIFAVMLQHVRFSEQYIRMYCK